MTHSNSLFHRIYILYREDLHRFAFFLCGNVQDAQDICAETFLRMWTAKAPPKMATMKSYLFTIARNIYLQKHRRDKKRQALDDDILDPTPPFDLAVADRKILAKTLRAMQTLSEVDRSILIMKAYHGMPYQAIAGVVDLSVATLKVRVHRAREKLARQLSKGEPQ